MILEIIAGILVSVTGILFFLSLKYNSSIKSWIIETSRFVYFLGHPLLDDDGKYEALTGHFRHVFKSLAAIILKTIALIAFVMVMVGIVSAGVYWAGGGAFGDWGWATFYPAWLYQWPFLAGTFVPIVAIPFLAKNKPPDDQPYSPIDQLLHYVFLGNSSVARFLFRIELTRHKKKLESETPQRNVYISGMARAGTTVLMQYLGQVPQFVSLSYRHMPFLFMPRTWIKMRSKRKLAARERAHKDGIIHSLDSYEALEEPFWRNFSGPDYIRNGHLRKYEIDPDLHEQYTAFRKLVAGDRIYLAKNNNHLLRAESLSELDRESGIQSKTIIPFREPYSQAQSLLNQHQLLSEMAMEDPFVKDYMEFLVHHEFGLSHKIPVLDPEKEQPDPRGDMFSKKYWLEIWYRFYARAHQIFKAKEDFYFFCYEDFCKNPADSLESLVEVLDMPDVDADKIAVREFKPKIAGDIDPASKFSRLYRELRTEAINFNNG